MCNHSKSRDTLIIHTPSDYFNHIESTGEDSSEKDEIVCFYSSEINAIVTDSRLFHISIFDRGFSRGHAIYDTLTIYPRQFNDGKLSLSESNKMHFDRMMNSCHSARILCGSDGEESGQGIDENVRRMVVDRICSICTDMCLSVLSEWTGWSFRIFLTGGVSTGSFNIGASLDDFGLYIVGFPIKEADTSVFISKTKDGFYFSSISEYTVDTVPMKPGFLATCKSNNYLLNVLLSYRARDLKYLSRNPDLGNVGGGIWVDNGFLAESCVSGLVALCVGVDGDRSLVGVETGVLKSVTVALFLIWMEKSGWRVSYGQINYDTNLCELWELGGDLHYIQVESLNDSKIGVSTGRSSVLDPYFFGFLKYMENEQ